MEMNRKQKWARNKPRQQGGWQHREFHQDTNRDFSEHFEKYNQFLKLIYHQTPQSLIRNNPYDPMHFEKVLLVY